MTARLQLDKVMTEDELLQAIIEAAELQDWLVYHVRNSKLGITQGDVGFPDLVLSKGSRLLLLELKSEAGKVTPAQERWLKRLKLTTTTHATVVRPSDLDTVLMWLGS